jgi:hypothetical protein
MEMVHMFGKMDRNMSEASKMITVMDTERCIGKTEEFIRENG